MPEMILILAIALIILGPKKLPEIAKSLGRGIAEFKKATQEFKENLDVDNDLKEARDTIREAKEGLEETVRESVTQATSGRQYNDVSEDKIEHTLDESATGDAVEPAKDNTGQESAIKEPAKDA